MWFLLALTSAILAGVRRTGEKQLLHQINQFTLGWTIQLLSLPAITASLLITGRVSNPVHLGMRFWLPILFGMLVFYPLNALLAGRAIRHGELSKVLPIQSFGPVFAMAFGFLLLGQQPSLLALLAICCTCAGIYTLHMRGWSLHNPIKQLSHDRPSVYMLLSTLLIAITVPIDAIAIKASTPATYAIVSTVSAAIVLYITAHHVRHHPAPPTSLLRPIAILGTIQGVAYITIVIAMTLGPVAYISAVKSSGILIGAITGIIVLKERLTPQKTLAFTLVGLGLALLAVSR